MYLAFQTWGEQPDSSAFLIIPTQMASISYVVGSPMNLQFVILCSYPRLLWTWGLVRYIQENQRREYLQCKLWPRVNSSKTTLLHCLFLRAKLWSYKHPYFIEAQTVLEKLNELSSIPQLKNGRTGILSYAFLPLVLCSSHSTPMAHLKKKKVYFSYQCFLICQSLSL